jgi:hypothetical protein
LPSPASAGAAPNMSATAVTTAARDHLVFAMIIFLLSHRAANLFRARSSL